jgi:hypothetical protein
MTRWRSSMILLGICVVAVLIGALRLATQRTPQPPGSSLSAAPDGALGLYTWLTDLGVPTRRLTTRAIDPDVTMVIVLDPAALPDRDARDAFSRVADRGGTLVVAGDSLQWLVTARTLGVTVEPALASTRMLTPDGLSLPFAARYRLHADGAQPLLLADDGQWLGLKMPYSQGSLIVIASPALLTNAGLRDDAAARFVFRDIVAPFRDQQVAFDEYARLPAASGPASLNQLLFQTSGGAAIIYAALLTFAFLLLAGRRLGPAVVAASAADSQRTMYEHVQMLANLYRRAGQLALVRETFSTHYMRATRRADSRRTAELAAAVARIQSARTEGELVAAVASVDDAG